MPESAEEKAAERSARAQANRSYLELARRSLTEESARHEVTEGGVTRRLLVTRRGVGPIATPFAGEFFMFDFEVDDQWRKYSVLFKGEIDQHLRPKHEPELPLLLRIDSGCETGQVFHDTSCECGAQMHRALELINESGQGLLISIPRQDGRGMGLPFKLATLTVQTEMGLDTVRAAALLDPQGERDKRTYSGAIAVLMFLGFSPPLEILLLTNNELKHAIFPENGYDATLNPFSTSVTSEVRLHLEAKKRDLGHHIDLYDSETDANQDAHNHNEGRENE